MARRAARRLTRWLVLAAGVVLVAIQLVPYGWSHPNPPVVQDTPWPSSSTAELARRACYDCHSNETDWPLYSYVAPASWLVRRDVENGREELNFSRWAVDREGFNDAAETIEDGSMPPRRYVFAHPSARLSARERVELVAALQALEDGADRGGGDGADGGDGSGSNRGRDERGPDEADHSGRRPG